MLTDEDLDAMLAKAGDGVDHEWGWYREDVPRLVAELRRLLAERAYLRACYDRAIGELHTARADLADQVRQTEVANQTAFDTATELTAALAKIDDLVAEVRFWANR